MKIEVERNVGSQRMVIIFKQRWFYDKRYVSVKIIVYDKMKNKGFEKYEPFPYVHSVNLDTKTGEVNNMEDNNADIIREEWLKIKDKFAPGRNHDE